MSSDTTGSSNVANGYNALASNLTGNGDTAIGYGALDAQMSGDLNIGLGVFAGNGVLTASNVICIGASGADVNDSCYIGNIWTQPGGSQAVYVNSDGKLGTQVSSRRFKEDIHPERSDVKGHAVASAILSGFAEQALYRHLSLAIVSTAVALSLPARNKSSAVLASSNGNVSVCVRTGTRGAISKNSSPSRRVRFATEVITRSSHKSAIRK